MSLHKLRTKALTLAVAAAIAGGVGITAAGPAAASSSQGFVSGTNGVKDDWDDEGTFSESGYNKGNAVALLQQVLWAEGVKEKNGTPFDYADIDGKYGPNTTYAVKQFQKMLNEFGSGLTVDGKAGKKTLGAAARLFLADNGNGTVTYWGEKHKVTFKRSGGKYLLKVNDTKGWKVAHYTTLNVV
jgi:peptidoglycan hydrolase-like protein with peptidoglycan-binding domain